MPIHPRRLSDFNFAFFKFRKLRKLFMNRFISFRSFAVVLAALSVFSLSAHRLAAQDVPFHVDGTFTFSVKGSKVSASGSGTATPGGNFVFNDVVKSKHGGRDIEGTLTLEFEPGSTLGIYYEAPVENYNGHLVVEGPYWVVDGTGVFEGASGSGIIWYPIGQGAPFTLDGTLVR
jgi:hypothetical protein